jgi:hypothetical protein
MLDVKLAKLAALLCILGSVLSSVAFAASDTKPGWKKLFNGKDLAGWQHVGQGDMTVENGCITTHGTGDEMGLLWWTGGKIGNAVIRVVYRTKDRADNSGIFIRIPIEPREARMPVDYGYEVNIEIDPARWNEDNYYATGSLYSFTKVPVRADHPSPEWNTIEITIVGPRTVVYVNSVKVTDYAEGDPIPPRRPGEVLAGPRPNEGYIGLQNWGGETVYFKDVEVRPLR